MPNAFNRALSACKLVLSSSQVDAMEVSRRLSFFEAKYFIFKLEAKEHVLSKKAYFPDNAEAHYFARRITVQQVST